MNSTAMHLGQLQVEYRAGFDLPQLISLKQCPPTILFKLSSSSLNASNREKQPSATQTSLVILHTSRC